MKTPRGCGLRDRKREATRLAIGAAALELVTERGMNVTVEEIADRAGVSPRTFFNYFSSKEEAVTLGHAIHAQAFVDALQARPSDEPVWTSLRVVTVEALAKIKNADASWVAEARLAGENPTVLAQILLLQHHQEMQLTAALTQRPELADHPRSARLIAALWASAVRAAVDVWIDDPETNDLTDLVESVFRTLNQVELVPSPR